MKIVFLGTPDFAVGALKSLIESKHEVVAVVTQPDKIRGRNTTPTFSPVKEVAVKHSLPVLQYEKIRLEGVEELKNLQADAFVTCAYGQILSQEIIDIPKHGILNIHASLLPKYRGAAPIQWSIINGDEYTGVTIMRTEKGIDTGDVLLSKSLKIGEEETAGQLFDRLSALGSQMIVEALDLIEEGKAVFTPQNHEGATHVRMLSKEDGLISWDKSPQEIKNLVRGMSPWPSAYTRYNGKTIKIWGVTVMGITTEKGNGEIISSDRKNGILVACGGGVLRIDELQLEGAKRMFADAFLLGRSFDIGAVFTR